MKKIQFIKLMALFASSSVIKYDGYTFVMSRDNKKSISLDPFSFAQLHKSLLHSLRSK